jgi:hypothetical protein
MRRMPNDTLTVTNFQPGTYDYLYGDAYRVVTSMPASMVR